MKCNFKKLVSLLLVMSVFFMSSLCSFASTDQYHLSSGNSIAWNSIRGQNTPPPAGVYFSKVVYLSKLEAIAVAEGYRDSAFKNELVQVIDKIVRVGAYSGGYILTSTIVSTATKMGCKKVAGFFSGVGGAIALGFLVDDYVNFVKYIDYNDFKRAIDSTRENYFVQIKVGTIYSWEGSPTSGVVIREYNAWNSNTVVGMPNFSGYWNGNLTIDTF